MSKDTLKHRLVSMRRDLDRGIKLMQEAADCLQSAEDARVLLREVHAAIGRELDLIARAEESRARNGSAVDRPGPGLVRPARFCPKCEGRMVPRRRREDQELFWGCEGFPECRGTLPMDPADRDWLERSARSQTEPGEDRQMDNQYRAAIENQLRACGKHIDPEDAVEIAGAVVEASMHVLEEQEPGAVNCIAGMQDTIDVLSDLV